VRHGLFEHNHEAAINLGIPGYEINLQREIVGSVQYIRDRLAGGKPVNILLWSGDTLAPMRWRSLPRTVC
jgi:hypothetical protein